VRRSRSALEHDRANTLTGERVDGEIAGPLPVALVTLHAHQKAITTTSTITSCHAGTRCGAGPRRRLSFEIVIHASGACLPDRRVRDHPDSVCRTIEATTVLVLRCTHVTCSPSLGTSGLLRNLRRSRRMWFHSMLNMFFPRAGSRKEYSPF
jgi:hypothetical protein